MYKQSGFYNDPIRKPENSSGVAILALLLTFGIISGLLIIGALIGRHFYPTEYARYIPVHVTSTETLIHNHTDYKTDYQKVKITVTQTVTEHGKPNPDPTITVIETVTPSPAPA